MNAPAIDKEAAIRFLNALAPDQPVVFQTFDDSKTKDSTLAATIPAPYGVIPERLLSLNTAGAGAFICINRTDDTGKRKAENITAVRALFIDCDTVDHDRLKRLPVFKLEPSTVIESSPGKHHFYWFVDDMVGAFPLDRFTAAQKALAAAFDSDPSVNDLSRVMRLPGFIHQKDEPFQTRILRLSEISYLPHELLEWIETLQAEQAPAQRQALTQAPLAVTAMQRDTYAARAIQNAVGALFGATDGTRNDTLNREAFGLYGLAKAGRLNEHEVTDQLTRAAQGNGLSDNEIRTTLQSAMMSAAPRYEGLPSAANDYQHTGGIAWPGDPLAPAIQGHPIAARPRLKLTPMSELLIQPEPLEWLISDYLLPESNALLFGAPAAGKSFICIDWAASIALGRDWNNRAVKCGPVIYLAGEGQHGIRRRFKAWGIHHNVEQELENAPIFVSDRGGAMDTHEGLLDVLEAVDEIAEIYGPPVLIMVDTLHRNMTGDENAAKDMSAYFSHVDALRIHYGATVITVHHSGHGDDKRSRGSSAIKGAVDTELMVAVSGEVRTLKGTKQKDGPLPADMSFQLTEVILPWITTEGKNETSAVPVRTDAPPPRQKNMPPAIRFAVDSFMTAALEHGIWKESVDGQKDLTLHLEDWRTAFNAASTKDSQEATKKAFQRARSDMAAANALAVLNDVYWLTTLTAPWPDMAASYSIAAMNHNHATGQRDMTGT